MRNTHKFFVGIVYLRAVGCEVWTEFVWLRIGTTVMNFWVPWGRGVFLD
jgi:hypothetical protein